MLEKLHQISKDNGSVLEFLSVFLGERMGRGDYKDIIFLKLHPIFMKFRSWKWSWTSTLCNVLNAYIHPPLSEP